MIVENEQCLLRVMYPDMSSVDASLLPWTRHVGCWTTCNVQLLLEPSSLHWLCLGEQVVKLRLSGSSELCGHFYLKVMGILLLCPTSFSLLFESQMDLFHSPSCLVGTSLCPSLFIPRWHSFSPISWDRKVEWLTENEIYSKVEEMKIYICIIYPNIIHVTVNEMNTWASQ